jgi:hypothetical protein
MDLEDCARAMLHYLPRGSFRISPSAESELSSSWSHLVLSEEVRQLEGRCGDSSLGAVRAVVAGQMCESGWEKARGSRCSSGWQQLPILLCYNGQYTLAALTNTCQSSFDRNHQRHSFQRCSTLVLQRELKTTQPLKLGLRYRHDEELVWDDLLALESVYHCQSGR